MRTAEETLEVGNVERWQAGAWSATTHTNSPAVHSGFGSQSTQTVVGQIARLGGNSTQQPFGQYMRMIEKFSAGASQPVSTGLIAIDLPPSNRSDAILDNATDEQLDAMIAAAMPSLDDLEDMAADGRSEWLDDTSWIDDVD